MNAKYTLALIFALQVSMSLCVEPSDDLVEKYNGMKAVFYKRLLNAFSKLQTAAAPMLESVRESEQGKAAKDRIVTIMDSPQTQALGKIASGVGSEALVLVDHARLSLLGLYGEYLRPHIGQQLSDSIDNIKIFLDKHLPAA